MADLNNLEYTRSYVADPENPDAIPLLDFSKTWNDPNDFATVEADEVRVRSDMQLLHDETKNYINEQLIPAVVESAGTEAMRTAAETARVAAEQNRVEAEQTRVAAEQAREDAERAREDATTGIVAQAAVEVTKAESWAVGNTGTRAGEDTNNAKYWADRAAEIVVGTIPDGSLTTAKLADGAVTTAKLSDGVVTMPKLNEDLRASIIPTYTAMTMVAASWVSNTYSFEADYPHGQYNISIEVAPTATSEQFEAFGGAMICGSVDSNIATALGDVPTVDIPIIIKAVAK